MNAAEPEEAGRVLNLVSIAIWPGRSTLFRILSTGIGDLAGNAEWKINCEWPDQVF